MLSVSLHTNTARRPAIARIILATMLMIVLLAVAVPFSSLSSTHECGMACCAGKPSHMAGSCGTALGNEAEAGQPSDLNEESHSAHGHKLHSSGATSQAATSTKQRKSVKRSSARHSKSGAEASSRAVSVAARFMTTPCSPECAAAISASTQVRRPRDPLTAAVQLRPPPAPAYLLAGCFTVPSPKSAEGRRLSRPRAPPVRLNTLSA